jgi:hypothetical protein
MVYRGSAEGGKRLSEFLRNLWVHLAGSPPADPPHKLRTGAGGPGAFLGPSKGPSVGGGPLGLPMTRKGAL